MNIFEVLTQGNSRLHEPSMSAMLGYLLDSHSDHGLGDRFVRIFLEKVNRERFNQFLQTEKFDYRASLEEEYYLNGKVKYIDIQLDISKEGKILHRVIIENKIKASSANQNQLKDYYDAVIGESKDIGEDNITFIFLTPESESIKLLAEYENLTTANKEWIYWNSNEQSNEKSITHILEVILKQEAFGEISPINEYVRHTLKAFRRYCLDVFDNSPNRKTQYGDIGKSIDEVEIILNNQAFKVVKRDSGQIQVFDSEGNKVSAKPILIEYIDQHPESQIEYLRNKSDKLNTREIGRKFFRWQNKIENEA